MYFEATCRYQKMLENGSVKKVSEKYLVEAVSVTDAEVVVNERLKEFVSGDFFTTAAKISHIAELFGEPDAPKFYLAKVGFLTLDEVSAQEKRSISQMLVGADEFDSARRKLGEAMPSTTSWEIVSLAESPIIEVFKAPKTDEE